VTDLVTVLILLVIIFVVEWGFALSMQRLNRESSAHLAKAMGLQEEMTNHIIDVIDDLRGIQPEKDEILEICALQIRSLHESAMDQRKVMERMSTKLPFWIHLAPISVVAKRQSARSKEQRARTQRLDEWREEHGPDPDTA